MYSTESQLMFFQNISWLSTIYMALYPKDRTFHSLLCLLIHATWFSDKKYIYTKLNHSYRYSCYMPVIIHTQKYSIYKDTAMISSKSYFALCPNFSMNQNPEDVLKMCSSKHKFHKKVIILYLIFSRVK